MRTTLLASIKDAIEKQLEWQKGVPLVFPLTGGSPERHHNNVPADMAGASPAHGHQPMPPPSAIPAEVVEEICSHVERARKESRRFVGRADELAEAMDVLFPQQQQQLQLQPKPMLSTAGSMRGPIAVAAARSRHDMAGTTLNKHIHTYIHVLICS